MGIILSRIWKRKSTVEILEKLENDIKKIEENRLNAQRKYKKITKLLLGFSLLLYVLCGMIFYYRYNSTVQEKLLYLVPLAISPLLLYIVRRIISWYYVRLLNKNQIRLNEMKKEKKRILEEVMDKESYKVAKQILEKFSNENASKSNVNMQLTPLKQFDDRLRKRIVNNSNVSKAQTPGVAVASYSGVRTVQSAVPPAAANRAFQAPVNVMAPLPAPILPLNRSYMDRVVEYLIGDGPNNRYALICSRCHSHNGMALKEEFEYIGFKCCYCFNYNPARKIRPEAPKLESPLALRKLSESDSDSKNSGENSDSEFKPQIEFDKEGNQPKTLSTGFGVDSKDDDAVTTEKCDETMHEEDNNFSALTGAESDEQERKDKEVKEVEGIIQMTTENIPESETNTDCDRRDSGPMKS